MNPPGQESGLCLRPSWVEGMYAYLEEEADKGPHSNFLETAANMRRCGLNVEDYVKPRAGLIRERLDGDIRGRMWWFFAKDAADAVAVGVDALPLALECEAGIREYLRKEEPGYNNDNVVAVLGQLKSIGFDVSAELKAKEPRMREILRSHAENRDWWSFGRDTGNMANAGLDVKVEVEARRGELMGRLSAPEGDMASSDITHPMWDFRRYASWLHSAGVDTSAEVGGRNAQLTRWLENIAAKKSWYFMAEQLAGLSELGALHEPEMNVAAVPPLKRFRI